MPSAAAAAGDGKRAGRAGRTAKSAAQKSAAHEKNLRYIFLTPFRSVRENRGGIPREPAPSAAGGKKPGDQVPAGALPEAESAGEEETGRFLFPVTSSRTIFPTDTYFRARHRSRE